MKDESTGPLRMLATEGLEKGRVEALTDGIMAVAMTILVLDIKFDGTESITTDGHLLSHLLDVERTFTVYLISFIVLGMFWVAHHIQFHFVRRVDRGLLWINLAFMLLVTIVPFTTSVMIDYEQLTVPILLYGANLLLLSFTLLVNLRYVARHPRLADDDLTPEVVAYLRRRLLLFATIPALSMAVAPVSSRASLYLYAGMAILHFMPRTIDGHVSRWLERPRR
jgi:uncharacterized membrane protein